MKKLLVGAATAAFVLGTTAALAQMPAPMAPQGRAHTRAEVAGHVQAMFARADANRDGFITKAEAAAMRGMAGQRKAERRGQRQGQGFERMDTNRDGSISRAEWDVRAAQRQQRMATRRNGD
ncbi:MAG: EF-hand domain-containing protein, partial [Sphingomicrobium sp.]